MAAARLQKELKENVKNPTEGIKIELPDDSNMFQWHIFLKGPPDTSYEGGVFKLEMNFPKEYPNKPPQVRFLSDMWHPNVYSDGNVCISILHVPDPLNPQESPDECWRPIHTSESIVMSIISMLADPNINSPANVDASKEWRDKKDAYRTRVLKLVEKSKKEFPDFEWPKVKKPTKQPEVDEFLEENWDNYSDEELPEDDDMEEEQEEDELQD